MFIRFVVGAPGEDHRYLTGLVAEARFLQEAGELSTEEIEVLEGVYEWLNSNLPCPPWSERGLSRPSTASWFKHTAIEPIRQMRILAALLEHHGRGCQMLRSKNPGLVLYEDDFQIVVSEWKIL